MEKMNSMCFTKHIKYLIFHDYYILFDCCVSD